MNGRGDVEFPPEFLAGKARMTERYLAHDDPYLQSGFGAGPERWRNERRPILQGIDHSGTLLDLGCANGWLLECLVEWGLEEGLELVPFGVDQSAKLIELAKQRHPDYTEHFFAANVWAWQPPRRFSHVYTLADVVPKDLLDAYLHRLLDEAVEPGGTLIIGSYGSHSRKEPSLPLESLIPSFGLPLAGSTRAGPGEIVCFAWVRRRAFADGGTGR